MLYVIGGPSFFFVSLPVYDAPYLLVGFVESVVVDDDEADRSRADPYFLTGSFFEAVDNEDDVSYLDAIFSLDAQYLERAVVGVVVFKDDKLPVRFRVEPYFGVVVVVDGLVVSFDVDDLYLDV